MDLVCALASLFNALNHVSPTSRTLIAVSACVGQCSDPADVLSQRGHKATSHTVKSLRSSPLQMAKRWIISTVLKGKEPLHSVKSLYLAGVQATMGTQLAVSARADAIAGLVSSTGDVTQCSRTFRRVRRLAAAERIVSGACSDSCSSCCCKTSTGETRQQLIPASEAQSGPAAVLV